MLRAGGFSAVAGNSNLRNIGIVDLLVQQFEHAPTPVKGNELYFSTACFACPYEEATAKRPPLTCHALELVSAALLELEPWPDHEVAQRARHEHVVWARPVRS